MDHSTQGQAQENDGAREHPAPSRQGKTRRKLDLSGLEAPADLEESSIEEMTIDGICGVY